MAGDSGQAAADRLMNKCVLAEDGYRQNDKKVNVIARPCF